MGFVANVLKFERISYLDCGDGAEALIHNGKLLMYGDTYHDKIAEQIDGFFAGLDFAEIEYEVEESESNGDMYSEW